MLINRKLWMLLSRNITQEINVISISMRQRVSRNVEKRIRACLLANGGQFEHLLSIFFKINFFFRFDVVLANITENFMYLS